MREVSAVLLTVSGYIGIAITKIWAVVSFILYLAKDKPFNWASIWLMLLSWIAILFGTALCHGYKEKRVQKESTSRWQKRLDEMQRVQAEKIKRNGL